MKYFNCTFFKNGSWLVIIIVALGIVGSGLTVWNYSQHVFSSNHGKVIDLDGIVEVSFPEKAALKIHAHQSARVTFEVKDAPKKIVHDAVVISVANPTFAIRDGDISQYTRPQNDLLNHSCMKHTPHDFKNHFEAKSLQNLIHSNCESRVDVITLRLTTPTLENLTLGEDCSVTIDTTIPPLP